MVNPFTMVVALVAGAPAVTRADGPRDATLRFETGGGIGVPEPAGLGFLNLIADARFAVQLGFSRWSLELGNQLRYGLTEDRFLSDFTYTSGGQTYREHPMLVLRWSQTPRRTGSCAYLRLGAGVDVMYVDVDVRDEGDGHIIPGARGLKVGPALLVGPGVSWPLSERSWIAAEFNVGLNLWRGEWYPLLDFLPLDLDLMVVAGWSLAGS